VFSGSRKHCENPHCRVEFVTRRASKRHCHDVCQHRAAQQRYRRRLAARRRGEPAPGLPITLDLPITPPPHELQPPPSPAGVGGFLDGALWALGYIAGQMAAGFPITLPITVGGDGVMGSPDRINKISTDPDQELDQEQSDQSDQFAREGVEDRDGVVRVFQNPNGRTWTLTDEDRDDLQERYGTTDREFRRITRATQRHCLTGRCRIPPGVVGLIPYLLKACANAWVARPRPAKMRWDGSYSGRETYTELFARTLSGAATS